MFDPETGTVEVIASPLELTSDSDAAAVNVISFEDIESPFGQGSLFIDDATNTCQGLAIGVCSSGISSNPDGCTMDVE